MTSPRVPPRFVPTLTEVVEFRDALVVSDPALVLPEPLASTKPGASANDAPEPPLIEPIVEPAAPPVPEPDLVDAPAAITTEDVPAFLLAAPGGAVAAIGAPAVIDSAEPVVSAAEPADAAQPIDAGQEEQIVHNVLAELQRRTDLMLEYRLREALNPILARVCDTLIKEAREDLAATLRDVVARAVAQELGRHRPK